MRLPRRGRPHWVVLALLLAALAAGSVKRASASSTNRSNPFVLSQCAKDVAKDIEANRIPPTLFVPHWTGYRLGDCISFCKCGWVHDLPQTTMAAEYAPGCSRSNYTRLLDILKRRDGQDKYECPEPDALVIHLRLGDKVEKAYFEILKRLDFDQQRAYVRFIDGGWEDKLSGDIYHSSFIKGIPELVHDARSANVSTVYIVSGTHYRYADKLGHMSYVYLQCLKRAMTAEGLEVKMRISEGSPDQDFYFLACSRNIAVSAGGFSRHAGNLAQLRGGTQVGRTFNKRATPRRTGKSE